MGGVPEQLFRGSEVLPHAAQGCLKRYGHRPGGGGGGGGAPTAPYLRGLTTRRTEAVMALKKLLYAGHEIRLRDDEDLAALTERVTEVGDGFVPVTEDRGAIYQLRVGPGIPVVLVDTSQVPPPPAPVGTGM